MFAPNDKFLKCKTPHGENHGAFAKPSQGQVWRQTPVAESNSKLRPASRVRSTPMWQAQTLA